MLRAEVENAKNHSRACAPKPSASSDISALKKQKQDLELRQTKAAQQVEKAMAQIDQVLGAE
jgi:hypothetical protein